MNLLNPTADDKEKRRRLNRPSKRIRIKESRKFLLVVETRMGESFLVETGILGFAIREIKKLKESGIPLTIGILEPWMNGVAIQQDCLQSANPRDLKTIFFLPFNDV